MLQVGSNQMSMESKVKCKINISAQREERIVPALSEDGRFQYVSRGSDLAIALDLIRGLAAFLVMIGHARPAIFMDYAEVNQSTLGLKLFYASTLFPTQAVVCFFVVSGYLVGGRVLGGLRSGDFRPTRYAIDRMARIYTVLIPTLALSALLLLLHQRFAPIPRCMADGRPLGLMVLENLAMLQSTVSTPMCNNFPLWSLANEVWYYIMFPLLGGVVVYRSWICVVLMLAIGLFLASTASVSHTDAMLYFPLWLLGLLPLFFRLHLPKSIAMLPFLGALVVSRLVPFGPLHIPFDYVLALTLVMFLAACDPALRRRESWARKIFGLVGGSLASVSYSLYLVHFPLLLSARIIIERVGVGLPLNPHRGSSYFILLLVLLICVGSAYVMYLLCEMHTPRVRSRMERAVRWGEAAILSLADARFWRRRTGHRTIAGGKP